MPPRASRTTAPKMQRTNSQPQEVYHLAVSLVGATQRYRTRGVDSTFHELSASTKYEPTTGNSLVLVVSERIGGYSLESKLVSVETMANTTRSCASGGLTVGSQKTNAVSFDTKARRVAWLTVGWRAHLVRRRKARIVWIEMMRMT
jgi:hypothetical protein